VSLRKEWTSNLGQKLGPNDPFNPRWQPKPGDAVCDTQDRKGTYGIIVAILPMEKNNGRQAWVLWSKDLQLKDHEELVNRMAKDIADEEDNQIMKILMDDS
jgi:hypothetical protein